MKTSLETERLYFREFRPEDETGLFELDSDPEVHRYLGNSPVRSVQEIRDCIAGIQRQYQENGIGRWAMIVKETGEFAGWAGLKVEKNVNGHESFFDMGYRIIKRFWGRGYATEATRAFIEFGFREFKPDKICAYTSMENRASRRVLEKCGFTEVNTFLYDGEPEIWYELHNANYNVVV